MDKFCLDGYYCVPDCSCPTKIEWETKQEEQKKALMKILINELGIPKTLEQAIAERNNWFETARTYRINADFYRKQRNALLIKLNENPALWHIADRVVGFGWKKLIEEEEK